MAQAFERAFDPLSSYQPDNTEWPRRNGKALQTYQTGRLKPEIENRLNFDGLYQEKSDRGYNQLDKDLQYAAYQEMPELKKEKLNTMGNERNSSSYLKEPHQPFECFKTLNSNSEVKTGKGDRSHAADGPQNYYGYGDGNGPQLYYQSVEDMVFEEILRREGIDGIDLNHDQFDYDSDK